MILTHATLKEFAIESYTNPQCLGVEEFKSDFIKLLRLNRSIESFKTNRDKGMAVRTLLNTFITLLNVFEHKALVRMACFKVKEEGLPVALTVFEFLSALPRAIPELDLSKYCIDEDLMAKLKAL